MTQSEDEYRLARKPRAPVFRRSSVGSQHASFGPRTLIGVAHVALGVTSLLNGFAAIGFTWLDGGSGIALAVSVVTMAFAVALVLAGLWMRDGQRKGAYVSIGINGIRAVMFLALTGGLSVDFALATAMIGASVWLLPSLESRSSAEGV